MIEDDQFCSSSVSLSLAFAPFRAERSIKAAVGDGDAAPGSWLGPERPSVFDDRGSYIDALTGRRLLPGDGYSSRSGGDTPQASCDGRVVVNGSTGPSLAIVSPVRSGRRLVASRRQVVALQPLGDVIDAQWSPDGRELFYVLHRTRANSSSLWRIGSDGRGRRLMYTDRSSSDLQASVAPDGRWVLLSVLDGANQELWLVRSDGRRLHPLSVGTTGAYVSASAEWSPRGDRRFVIEGRTALAPTPSSVLPPTTTLVFVIRPDGRARHTVAYPASASLPIWSPDERDVAYAIGASVAIAPVAGGPSRTVLTAMEPLAPGATGPSVLDWQAAPGTGRPFSCLDGRPPF
jgi:dipeptidyl aminopeptidase/acylaminoacyl peptidase